MADTKVSALADNGDIDPTAGGDFYFVPSGAAVGKRLTVAEMYRFTALEIKLDKTADYPIVAADIGKTVRVDATAGAVIITLPAAGVIDGDTITVRKSSADASSNRITVKDNGGTEQAWLTAARDEVVFAWWGGTWIVDQYYVQPLRQTFTGSGTWAKPPLMTAMDVIAFGAGGGGGSGSRKATGGLRTGGSGGAAGASIYQNLPTSALGATEAVTVGAGGGGGASATVDAAPGSPGVAGGDTTLGALLRASGGPGGLGGTTAARTGGLAPATSTYGTSTNGADSTIAAVPTTIVAASVGGGGAGGGRTAADAAILCNAGGSGSGSSATPTAAGTAGTTGTPNGGNGGDAASATYNTGGGGGGGGYSNSGAAGGTGGNGGTSGGGGGGGSASDNGFASGAGGTGGRGEVRLIMYFS